MKIAIAGAGAMGASFGYMLQKSGKKVVLIDQWEPHIKAIKEDGLHVSINGKTDTEKMTILRPEEVTDDFDFIIMFTKSMQLEDMLNRIQPLLKKETKVLSLLNGLGHGETLAKYTAKENISLGTTVWTAGIDRPGTVHFLGGGIEMQNIGFGEKADLGAKAFVQLLNDANLNATYSEDIFYSIWKKICVNSTMNALCTIIDTTMGQLATCETTLPMMENIVNEITQVAKKEGIALSQQVIMDLLIELMDSVGPHYPSMHQDLIQSHRFTEINYINGAVARKGDEYGIPTPYNKLATQLILAKEKLLVS